MPLQASLIGAGAAVIALEEAYRGKLDQVLIADPVLREQDEMRIRGAERRVSGGLLPRMAAAEREVGLEAQNRADLSRFGFGVKRPRAVQVAVIGDRQRVHAERLHPIEQVGDAVGAVEERVLAMRVEMNERHVSVAESAVFCALMQWLLLFLTLLVMALLERFGGAFGAPLEALATLALGCLTLAATLTGTIAQRLRLPRIVGYLLAGFIAGPAWLRIVREPELQTLNVVSNGALALIAFAVGSELTLDALRSERRAALLRIVTGAMAVPFAAVTLVVLTVSPWFPLTAHQPFRDALVVAPAPGT